MQVAEVILNRDEFLKAKLRATFYKKLEDRVDGKLPDLIDDALETGFRQAHEEWLHYIEKRSKPGGEFLHRNV